jgi:hypothetical protein
MGTGGGGIFNDCQLGIRGANGPIGHRHWGHKFVHINKFTLSRKTWRNAAQADGTRTSGKNEGFTTIKGQNFYSDL